MRPWSPRGRPRTQEGAGRRACRRDLVTARRARRPETRRPKARPRGEGDHARSTSADDYVCPSASCAWPDNVSFERQPWLEQRRHDGVGAAAQRLTGGSWHFQPACHDTYPLKRPLIMVRAGVIGALGYHRRALGRPMCPIRPGRVRSDAAGPGAISAAAPPDTHRRWSSLWRSARLARVVPTGSPGNRFLTPPLSPSSYAALQHGG